VVRRLRRVDWLGALLLMVGGALVLLPMVQAARLSGAVIASSLVVGVVLLMALARHERRTAEPILPLGLWRNRVVALANCGSFAMGAVIMGVSAFLPTYVEAVMGGGAAAAGTVLGAQPVGWAIAAFVAGRAMVRIGYRASLLAGASCMIIGSAFLTAMTPASGPLWAACGAFLVGTGMGFCNTTYLVAVQAAVARLERGAATSSNLFMRTLGQATGAALFGAVVNAGVLRHAPDAGQTIERLLHPMLRGGLDPAAVAQVTDAMAGAIRIVYLMCAALGLVVMLLGARLPADLRPADR
jgi:fucose permease